MSISSVFIKLNAFLVSMSFVIACSTGENNIQKKRSQSTDSIKTDLESSAGQNSEVQQKDKISNIDSLDAQGFNQDSDLQALSDDPLKVFVPGQNKTQKTSINNTDKPIEKSEDLAIIQVGNPVPIVPDNGSEGESFSLYLAQEITRSYRDLTIYPYEIKLYFRPSCKQEETRLARNQLQVITVPIDNPIILDSTNPEDRFIGEVTKVQYQYLTAFSLRFNQDLTASFLDLKMERQEVYHENVEEYGIGAGACSSLDELKEGPLLSDLMKIVGEKFIERKSN